MMAKPRHRMKLLLAAVLIFSLHTSIVYGESIPWPMYKHDPQNTGKSPFKGSEENTLRWIFGTQERIQGSPTIGPDGTIYITSHDSTLYAINPDGTEKWHYIANMIIDSTPAIAPDGTIYFGSWDHILYAITSEGRGKWGARVSDRISSSPTIGPDGTVYIAADDRFLYAINPDGTLQWSFGTGERIFSTAALSPDGTVYIGSFDDHLYAINPDGTEKWRFKTNGFVFSSPAIAPDGTVYVGSYDEHLYAINPDGTEKWRFKTDGIVQSSPSIDSDGTIYFGSFDTHLYAINPDGTEKWRFKTDGIIASSPAIDSEGTIYVGSVDTFLYAINPDGTEKWRFKTNDRIFSSPAIDSEGTIYVGSVDGNLYAIGKPLEAPFGLPTSGRVNELLGYSGSKLYVTSTSVIPDHPSRAISVEVVLKNIDNRPIGFALSSFKLTDLDGNEYDPDPEKSTLKSVRIQNDDTIRGVLFFTSTNDIYADQLLYRDLRGVRLSVDLNDAKVPADPEPLPSLMPGSNIGQKIIGTNLEMSIINERFLESDPQQYVITLSLRNRSLAPIEYDQTLAYIKDARGNVYLPDTSRQATNPFRGVLGPGQTVTGEIWFVIPNDVDSIVFVYDDIATRSYFVVPEFPFSMLAIAGAISLLIILSKFRRVVQKV